MKILINKFFNMKNQIKRLGLFLLLGATVISCQKDKFTEEDALKALQLVTVHINVRNASASDSAVPGATVRMVVDTTLKSAVTNANGVASFTDVKIGNEANIYVTKDGFTKVYTIVGTNPNDYRQTVVSTSVFLYETEGSNTVTISGRITAETNLTNRESERLSDVEVRVYNNRLSNTNQFFITESNSSGEYSVEIPVNDDGNDDILVYFPILELDRTVAKSKNNVYSVVTEKAFYVPSRSSSFYQLSNIQVVPSALVEVAEPPASGTGFGLNLKPLRRTLSIAVVNENSDEAIVNGGGDYVVGQVFKFTADNSGNQAELEITSIASGGVITGVQINDNLATYESMPTIATPPTNGAGAVFDLEFASQYKVFIQNGGAGYVSFPKVGAEYGTSPDNTSKVKKEFDPDLDNGNSLGGGNLFNNAIISNGKIVVLNEAEGDTLFTTGNIYGANPVFTYSEEIKNRAIYYVSGGNIDVTHGTISNAQLVSGGAGEGYDFANPPVVTVTALAGYGTGAEFKAIVDVNGNLDNNGDLIVMKEGSGYVRDVNDWDDDGNGSEEAYAEYKGFDNYSNSDNWGRHYNVKPGNTYSGDLFYGTGDIIEE